jgi:hypothetical protein
MYPAKKQAFAIDGPYFHDPGSATVEALFL